MLQNIWKWEHYTKQGAWALGVTQQKHRKSHLKICNHRETKYCPKILMEKLQPQTIQQMMWIPLVRPKYENWSQE
jgi:hypothetical protein